MKKVLDPQTGLFRIDRRQMLGGLTALAGTTLVGMSGPARAQGAPVRGGTLRIAFADNPDTLDPQRTASFVARQFNTLVYDTLTTLDAHGLPQPQLAERWWSENDAQEWVFELRKGVMFHHGRELTAADVVATIARMEDPALAMTTKGSFGPVKEVVAEDAYRVRIFMTQPFGEAAIAAATDKTVILPADRIEDLVNNPVGTGAFRFKAFNPGSSLSVERNPDYWMADQVHLDGIEILSIKESIAQQAALRSGDIDIITLIPPEAYLVLSRTEGVRAYSAVGGAYHALMTQSNLAPFDNPKVREAFKYIIDRESLINAALFGQGSVGNDHPIPADNFFLPELEQHRQDLPRARALLDEAGAGALTLDLWTSSDRPPAPKMALAFAEAAGQIGVTINVRDVPYTEYAANVVRKKPLYNSYLGALPTMYQMIYRSYHSKGAANYGKTEPAPGTDALIEELIAAPDDVVRKEVTARVMAKLHPVGERIVPYFQNYIAATTERVQNYVVPKYNIMELRWIWLSA